MTRTHQLIVVAALIVLSACGGPTAPTGPTPIIEVTGTLDFGNVKVGSSKLLTFTIYNRGTETLRVTSVTVSNDISSVVAFPDFAVSRYYDVLPMGSFSLIVIFSPSGYRTYSGTLQVNGNQSSGNNKITITGTGTQF